MNSRGLISSLDPCESAFNVNQYQNKNSLISGTELYFSSINFFLITNRISLSSQTKVLRRTKKLILRKAVCQKTDEYRHGRATFIRSKLIESRVHTCIVRWLLKLIEH